MSKTAAIALYIGQLDELANIVNDANQRIIDEKPDDFVYQNANFFTKSFLVISCAYIESYIKDVLMIVIKEMNIRLLASKLPRNLVRWNFNIGKGITDVDCDYNNLMIDIKKKELDDFISGNPHKAVSLFKNFGISLRDDEKFELQRELIAMIVVKRNKVVHHNDDASDLSNADLIQYITAIKAYLSNIDSIVYKFIN